MVLKAKNSVNGVTVNDVSTKIESLSGKKTRSDGVVVIEKEHAIYLPNTLPDFVEILDLMKKVIDIVPMGTLPVYQNPSFISDPQVLALKKEIDSVKENLK